jgi:hypothetical protein
MTSPLCRVVRRPTQTELKEEAAALAGTGRRPRSPRRVGSPLRASPRRSPAGSPARRQPVVLRSQLGGADGGAASDARRARWLQELQRAAAAGAEGRSPRAAAAEQLRRAASSRRLQRLWREFAAQSKTTRALAAAFAEAGLVPGLAPTSGAAAPAPAPAPAVAPAPAAAAPVFVGGVGSGQLPQHEAFDSFAEKLQSPRTLRAAAALFKRLEARLAAKGAGLEGAQVLLKRLFPAAAAAGRKVERYPVRVALVAFMIRAHPEVVFNKVVSAAGAGDDGAGVGTGKRPGGAVGPAGATPADRRPPRAPSPLQGDVEARLSAAAASMLAALEALLAKALEPAASDAAATAAGGAAGPAAGAGTLGALLVKFDDEWLEYLDQFVVWKGRDAADLERELIG